MELLVKITKKLFYATCFTDEMNMIDCTVSKLLFVPCVIRVKVA
jgi:hypothetical protein